MALSPELKEILVCPQCKGDLDFREVENEIHCQKCALAYAIEEGIPVMLVDAARPLGKKA